MGGILRHLDTRRFEPVVLAPAASIGVLRQRLAIDGLRNVAFRDTFNDAVRTIRESACDLIYYWEVGSDVLNYFLPFARLCPGNVPPTVRWRRLACPTSTTSFPAS